MAVALMFHAGQGLSPDQLSSIKEIVEEQLQRGSRAGSVTVGGKTYNWAWIRQDAGIDYVSL